MVDTKILIIDDEPIICNGSKMILDEQSYSVEVASCGREGLKKVLDNSFDLLLLDIKLPDIDGMDILREINQHNVDTCVIMMTGYGTVDNAVEAMKCGAFDFITKPFSEEHLLQAVNKAIDSRRLSKENLSLKKQLDETFDFSNIIGKGPLIIKAFEKIKRVAPMDSTVLLNGESGTGKELFANAIHEHSQRSAAQLLAVDCSTFSSSLLESELFGHVKGAFTGAEKAKAGIFEIASRGTLFLDEIANLDMDIQGKLLRVLETGEYKPIGSSIIKKTDARIIAASNMELKSMVDKGEFRSDLYYRLNVFPIYIPPLRERREDIPILIYHFLKIFCKKTGKNIKGFSDDALEILVGFDWPGNVRQLKNVVERLVIMSDSNQLNQKCLMDNFRMNQKTDFDLSILPQDIDELKIAKKRFLEENFSKIEKQFLKTALTEAGGNITKAAKQVKMQRSNFSALMKKHHIIVTN